LRQLFLNVLAWQISHLGVKSERSTSPDRETRKAAKKVFSKISSEAGRISPPRVAVLVAAWNQYGRGIIEGIWQYAQQHGPWILDMQPGEPDERTKVPEGWRGDGIIAAVHTLDLADKLGGYDVPVVNVSGTRLQGVDFPRVTSDTDTTMRMAVEHLRERGFQHIAFCGEPHRHFIDFWTDAFIRAREQDGETPLVYTQAEGLPQQPDTDTRRRDRQRWLEELPKPVGVIGWDTNICRHLVNACALAGIEVPEDVAVISLETEDLLGKTIHPPLSGVDIPVERIGFQVAAQLDQMLQGKQPESGEILLDPLGVTTRQSSDVLACDNPRLRQALRFIREHAREGIDVRDILTEVPMARRTLERQFQTVLGRSPAEEIRRTKIEHVRQLLGTTDIPIPEIAELCGYNYVEHMIPVFKKYHGCTPSRYRRDSRMRVARE
jgi:LacI family transcriptional regulator